MERFREASVSIIRASCDNESTDIFIKGWETDQLYVASFILPKAAINGMLTNGRFGQFAALQSIGKYSSNSQIEKAASY
jgi:hypothetical protein